MELSLYFFPPSYMNLLAYFIFFFLTTQKIPCRDPATVEYSECGLTVPSPCL